MISCAQLSGVWSGQYSDQTMRLQYPMKLAILERGSQLVVYPLATSNHNPMGYARVGMLLYGHCYHHHFLTTKVRFTHPVNFCQGLTQGKLQNKTALIFKYHWQSAMIGGEGQARLGYRAPLSPKLHQQLVRALKQGGVVCPDPR